MSAFRSAFSVVALAVTALLYARALTRTCSRARSTRALAAGLIGPDERHATASRPRSSGEMGIRRRSVACPSHRRGHDREPEPLPGQIGELVGRARLEGDPDRDSRRGAGVVEPTADARCRRAARSTAAAPASPATPTTGGAMGRRAATTTSKASSVITSISRPPGAVVGGDRRDREVEPSGTAHHR